MSGEVAPSVIKKKAKPLQERVYDQDGYKLRVDCVCFKDSLKKEVCIVTISISCYIIVGFFLSLPSYVLYNAQVLMVSSRNSDGCWTIPGGGLEPTDQTREAAALREAHEEVRVRSDVFYSY